MRQERKVLTVLFCDLVGFTQRAEEMDPEDVAALLGPYQARLKEELERYGGTVEKFIGDAVMALFGAPTAHEDDPERAVRAALAIRDFAQEEGIELRIGITTGEALVNLGARPEAGETMATGDVVNTAARLQAAAPVNGILVTQKTYEATKHAIEYAEGQPAEAKGKARPVPVWEALHARARVAVERVHGASLVGRRRELDLLSDALARARQEQAPQLVTLSGVPGIGKSRLVLELFNQVEADPELITWRHGRCLPYGDGVTFWALGEMVKAEAGILETDSAAETEAKLSKAVTDEWVRSHLRPLVGLATDAELAGDRRSEAFAAWRGFFEVLAGRSSLVLVFEDLHWADDSLLDFVDHLVDWASGVPLLVVCTARPELLERRPGWGGGKPNALTISLSPLSGEETAELVAELLERPLLEAETQAELLARAGGNPLYAEQYARILEERGLTKDLPLPETVQGIVAARLDGLQPEDKALLQDASVLGKTVALGGVAFVSGLQARVIEERLHALERKEFVRRERRTTLTEETEYSFRHLLVRDVAYGQIPRGERGERHRLAAEWIESLGRPEDHAEMLAYHYLEALVLTRAAGGDATELANRARLALRDAGDRALALNALPAAARFYEHALELWPEGDRDRSQLLFRYGSSLRNTERGAAVLDAAYEALVAAHDTESAAECQAMLASLAWHEGDRDRCTEHLERAAVLLEDAPPSRAKAYILAQVSRYRMLAGEGREAIRVGEEALSMAEELGLEEVKASVLDSVGVARFYDLGDEGGFDDLERSISIALAASSAECVRGYTNLASALWTFGRLQRAVEVTAEGRRAAERLGDEIGAQFLLGHLLYIDYHFGRWDECISLATELIAKAEAGSPHYLEAERRSVRALIRLARGDDVGAVADVQASVINARRVKDPQIVEQCLAVGAFVLHASGDISEASMLGQELMSGWTSGHRTVLGDRALQVAWIAAGLGIQDDLLALLGKARPGWGWSDAARAVAGGDLQLAAQIYGEMGAVADEAYARLRAAEQLVERGRRAEADVQLQKALAFWRSVGATRYIGQCEELLAKIA
jgi:class 3 adenylate cyclase